MIIITEDDKLLFESIIGLTRIDNTQKGLMINLCNKYDLKGCNICKTCDAQVRQVYKKITNFYNKNKDNKNEKLD